MKKPKFKLDGESIKKFCVLHCEKVVLVLVLGVMAWLVYSGYSLPGLDPDKTPKALSNNSTDTKTFIDQADRWTTVVFDERKVPLDLEDRVDKGQAESDPRGYLFPFPWKPENFPKLSPRTDPTLLVPEKLRVIPIRGPLFSYRTSEEEVDPLYPPPTEEETKTKRPPRKAKPRSSYGPSDTAEGYGAPSMPGDYPGAEAGSNSYPKGGKRGSRRSSRGSGSAGMASSGYAPDSADSGSSGMYGSAGMGASGYGSTLPGGINEESIFGFVGDYNMGTARNVNAMVVLAVVPFEKQAENYLNSLSSSLDYEAVRDQPMYLGFLVERAEVPADNLQADPTTLTWSKINPKALKIEQVGSAGPPVRYGQWAGYLTDVVDPTYLDPNLTHPAPPFMQRDIWSILVHPEVPLANLAGSSSMYGEGVMPGVLPPGQKPATDAPVDDVPTFPGMVPGAGGYGAGADGASSYGPPGMASGGAGMPPMMGSSGYGSSGYGGSAMSGMMRSGSGMAGMSSGDMADGGYGGGYGGMGTTLAPPKYKMIRFTDTHVEEGKYYRYRVKVRLHDPNHPAQGYAPPSLASLAPEVQKRVTQLDAEDKPKKEMAPGVPYRTFWIDSDWSEPSEVATLPLPSNYFAGSVNQPATAVVVEGKPRLPNDQPSAMALTTVWDAEKVVDVPIEQKVYRGSILNFVQDAKVIHPVTHEVLDLKEYKFQTGALVADLLGGEVVSGRNPNLQEPLRAPGELLVIDANGDLHVQDETTDIDNFRRYLVPEPEKALPGGPGGASPYDSAEGGYESSSSAPGYSTQGGRSSRGSSSPRAGSRP